VIARSEVASCCMFHDDRKIVIVVANECRANALAL